jgi:hypothetical protein
MVIVALAAAGSIAAWLLSRPAPPPAVESAPTAAAPDPAVSSALTLATASFDARNYRAALAYAGQVLTRDPANAAAIKIRDESRRALSQFDAAVAEGRRHLAARDVRAAQRALDVARGIDPSAPEVTDLALRIGDLTRARASQDEGPRRGQPEAQPTREIPSPKQAAVPAPRPPATVETTPLVVPPPSVARPQEPPPAGGTPATPQPTPPKPAATPPSTSPSASGTAADRRETAPPAAPTEQERAAQDRSAIERLLQMYARAIETKDVGLYRSIKPNLSREEEQRLRVSFQAVASRVRLTIASIDRRGEQAIVVVKRRDTLLDGEREQAPIEREQVWTLQRTGRDWTIVSIR